MKARGRRSIGIVSVGGMLAVMVASTAPAGAAATLKDQAVSGSVPWSSARFAGYAAGDVLHTGALESSLHLPTTLPGITSTGGDTSVADVEQGFSGASVNSSGLASPVVGDDAGDPGSGLLIQPSESPSNNSYGVGSGLEVGLAVPSSASSNQLKLSGRAESVAEPNSAAVTDSLTGTSTTPLGATGSSLDLGGLASAAALSGRSDALYSSSVCPLGQPLSFGLGDAADATLLPTTAGSSTLPGLGSLNLPGVSTVTSLLSSLTSVLPGASAAGDLVTTGGPTTSIAQSDSETFLSANGDGSYGVSTQAREAVAPITINLLGLAKLVLTIGGTTPSDPLTLTARTTGERSGASVSLSNNAVISLSLDVAGTTTALIPPTSLSDIVGKGGITIPLDLAKLPTALTNLGSNLNLSSIPVVGSTLGSTLGGILTQLGSTTGSLASATSALPDVSLGYITIGTPVRAINSDPTTVPGGGSATVVGGTSAAGAFDLARVHLGLSVAGTGNGAGGTLGTLTGLLGGIPGLGTLLGSSSLTNVTLADVAVGHLEASSTLAAPIDCTIPVIKAANPIAVTAGKDFVYTIEIPNPADIQDLSCNLDDVSATDTISDAKGTPTFDVVGVSNGGVVSQHSTNSATINWTGLDYTVAAVGATPNPPITLTVTVATPSSSPSGIIQDIVNATGTVTDCNGGVSGITGLGGSSVLRGSYTLQQPTVTALTAAVTSAPAPAPQGALPHTGGTGGLWQPLGGLVVLGLGGGTMALVRRSRRRLS